MSKICPLMRYNPESDIIMLRNYDVSDDFVKTIKERGVIQIRDNQPEMISIMRGYCVENDCAWWNEETSRCCMNRQQL